MTDRKLWRLVKDIRREKVRQHGKPVTFSLFHAGDDKPFARYGSGSASKPIAIALQWPEDAGFPQQGAKSREEGEEVKILDIFRKKPAPEASQRAEFELSDSKTAEIFTGGDEEDISIATDEKPARTPFSSLPVEVKDERARALAKAYGIPYGQAMRELAAGQHADFFDSGVIRHDYDEEMDPRKAGRIRGPMIAG